MRSFFFLQESFPVAEPFRGSDRSTGRRSRLADERELWKKISNGDPEAFDAFYRECVPRLLSFVRHLLGEDQAAEDVMQNAFTEVWRRPDAFDPERGSLRAYLFGRVGQRSQIGKGIIGYRRP
jgi:RNA polymerase sigma-70 factor (ECF subfamily)